MDAKVGKLLLLSACLGCLGPALTIAACLSHRSPFLSDPSHQDAVARSQASLAAAGMPRETPALLWLPCLPGLVALIKLTVLHGCSRLHHERFLIGMLLECLVPARPHHAQ